MRLFDARRRRWRRSSRQVSTWATGQHYTPAAINTFLQAADFYLIAHALAGNHVVVTHEVPSNSPGRIKIPNACVA